MPLLPVLKFKVCAVKSWWLRVLYYQAFVPQTVPGLKRYTEQGPAHASSDPKAIRFQVRPLQPPILLNWGLGLLKVQLMGPRPLRPN